MIIGGFPDNYSGSPEMSMTHEDRLHIEPKGPGRPIGGKNKPGHHAGRPRKPKDEFSAAVWEHGRVHIELTQKHIDESMRANSSHCAGVAAIKATISDATFVSVDIATVRFSRNGCRYTCLTPTILQSFVIDYDQGNPVVPIEFTLKPAFISKAGKSRRHVPDPGQLREVGLRLAKDQPHVREPNGSEAGLLDVMAKDAPVIAKRDAKLDRAVAAEPAPKRRPRVARTMVSSATRGCVPTVLGGRPPPVLGARREFGIRALKR
jgi:hypothetical protein